MLANVSMQRLKSALWFSIGKIVDEETLKLGINATPQFIGALTEMVWAQIGRQQLPLTATTVHMLTCFLNGREHQHRFEELRQVRGFPTYIQNETG